MAYDEVVPYREGGLVEMVCKEGNLIKKLPSLKEIREVVMEELSRLPERLKSLHEKAEYKVLII